jgi:hypothetical protein
MHYLYEEQKASRYRRKIHDMRTRGQKQRIAGRNADARIAFRRADEMIIEEFTLRKRSRHDHGRMMC